jgi:hypothetical protein
MQSLEFALGGPSLDNLVTVILSLKAQASNTLTTVSRAPFDLQELISSNSYSYRLE